MAGEELIRVPRRAEGAGTEPVAEARIAAGVRELRIEDDGWYLYEGDGEPRRITVAEAITVAGARGGVLRVTRLFIAAIGRELAEGAWISPTAPGDESARSAGLDPKLPSEQIALAAEVIGRLAGELSAAEAG